MVGPPTLTRHLPAGAQVVPRPTLHATGAGRGVLHMDVIGPSASTSSATAAILVRPARGVGRARSPAASCRRASDMPLVPPLPLAGYVRAPRRPARLSARRCATTPTRWCGRWRTTRYPVWSRRPAAACRWRCCPDAPADRAGGRGASVLDRQRYDGGFGLWTASGRGRAVAVRLRDGVPAARPRVGGDGAGGGAGGRAEIFVRRGRRRGEIRRRSWPPRRTGCMCWRWPEKVSRGRRACWPSISPSADPAGESADRRRVGARPRSAARRSGVRGSSRCARPRLLAGRLRHRAARPGRDRRAAARERSVARPAGAAGGGIAGGGPRSAPPVHAGTGLDRGRRGGARP